MSFQHDDRKRSSIEDSVTSPSGTPGKVTRTSRLPSSFEHSGERPGRGASSPATVQAKAAPAGSGLVQAMPHEGNYVEALHFGSARISRKAAGTPSGADAGQVYEQATSGAGAQVPYRADMERSFGADFSGVQAYTGRSREMAAIGAEAATAGSDDRIAFASSTPSRETVAHELAHIQQARNTGAAGVQARSSVSQPGDAAEREADAVARKVAGGGTVAPGELTARGSGLQRKDVNVSAGAGQTETESTTRVVDQGNQFEDLKNAWDKLLAWKKGTSITFVSGGNSVTRAPTDADALSFFYELTPDQRNPIWQGNEGVLQHIFARFTKADAAKVMGLCDFPLRWKIRHWFEDISTAGGGRELLRTMISNSPLGQRLDVVKDETCIGHLVTTFADDHPENLFGDAIRAQLYPDDTTAATFDKAHPKFAEWRNKAEKLDAESRWAFVGKDPVANIAALKGQAASGGRNKWTSLLHWGPRGQALTPTMRANVDKAALDSGVSTGDRDALFQVRWNCELSDPGASFNKWEAVWKNLQQMPLGTISSDTVKEIELRIFTSGGAYTDYPHSGGFGDIWVGTSASLAYVGHTVRHEVGHAADTKLGGFANFSSKPPILWKKWMTEEPWLKDMMHYMDAPGGGDEGDAFLQLMKAAMSGSNFTSPLGAYTGPAVGPPTPEQQRQKLWKEVEDAYNNQGLDKALEVLKNAGKHTADPATIKKIVDDGQGGGTHPTSEPGYVRDHYFLKKYGEHYSYHKSGGSEVWTNGKLRAYTLCSPYEYFADMFAAYFETENNRDANVPAWAAGYFKQIESMYGADAVDDPHNSRSTAYGNSHAPQS